MRSSVRTSKRVKKTLSDWDRKTSTIACSRPVSSILALSQTLKIQACPKHFWIVKINIVPMDVVPVNADLGVKEARVVPNLLRNTSSLRLTRSVQLSMTLAIQKHLDRRWTSPTGNHNRKESSTREPSKKKTIASLVQAPKRNQRTRLSQPSRFCWYRKRSSSHLPN